MAHNVFLVYSLLHCQTIVHHFTVTVNNIEVTVNTHVHMFTIITTKDQSGGIIAQVVSSKQTLSSGYQTQSVHKSLAHEKSSLLLRGMHP